jgi:hypothetical protein
MPGQIIDKNYTAGTAVRMDGGEAKAIQAKNHWCPSATARREVDQFDQEIAKRIVVERIEIVWR